MFIAVATQSRQAVQKGLIHIRKQNKSYEPIAFYQATDPGYQLFKAFQGDAIPMVVIIDPKGFVRWQGNPHGDEIDGSSKLTSEVIADIISRYK